MSDLFSDWFKTNEVHDAALEGDAARLRALLQAGANANERAFMDTTPLMNASMSNKGSLHKMLKERREKRAKTEDEAETPAFDLKNLPAFDTRKLIADADRKREYNDTPIEDDPEAARVLLEFGADVNAIDESGQSALTKALLAGRTETARLLLEHGADFCMADKEGYPPLLQAAEARKLESVQLLLEWGADADYRTPQGETALMRAALGGRVEIARLLLERGQDVNTVNVNGVTALQRAAAKQHDAMIAFLKEKGANVGFLEAALLGDYTRAQSLPVPAPAERGPRWGALALNMAIQRGQTDLVRLLLANGVDPNAVNKGSYLSPGQAVIMQAVMRGNVECARLLLEAGADANGAAGQNTTPLDRAAQNGDNDMVNLLLAFGANPNTGNTDGITSLMGAVMRGHLETARKLLEAGADPNGKEKGIPMLHFASLRGNKEMVQLLLDFGANPLPKNRVPTSYIAGDNPEIAVLLKQAAGTDLHELAKAGKTDELLARLTPDTDINARNEQEQTLLMAALSGKQPETAKALIARGADDHAVNRHQQTALHYAVGVGDADMVRLLIARGVDITVGEAQGRSPLHFAASGGKTEIVQLLIEAGTRVGTVEAAFLGDLPTLRNLLDKGADVNAPNGAGLTPLMGAAKNGHNELIPVLLTRHADINAADERGQTALAHAISRKRLETAHLLLESGADVNKAGLDETMARRVRARQQDADPDTLEMLKGWEDALGMTPLMCAAVVGDVEGARLLLAHGADLHAVSGISKKTALSWAVMSGKADMTRFLLENGADTDARVHSGLSLLQIATVAGKNEEVVALLKQYRAQKTLPAE